MKQLTLATAVFERYAKTTRRAVSLAEMERVVPWSALCQLIEPFYPKPGNGRPPVGVERMLRISTQDLKRGEVSPRAHCS
jgi:transposase, IS5 family